MSPTPPSPVAPTLADLRDAVASAAAVRVVRRLGPVGDAGDPVFPPTYVIKDERGRDVPGQHLFETRRIDGAETMTVLLDSVQSQANRLEEALLAAVEDGARFPHVVVDFAAQGIDGLGAITSLDAPHRLADALLRDSLHGNTLFRASEAGRSWLSASIRDATGVFALCPASLLFGMWNSTGEGGGRGVKFARAIVSEMVGINARPGKRPSSRIDPARIERVAVYEAADRSAIAWTADEAEAAGGPDKPRPYKKKGRPSEINHGNIAPSVADGGVTIDHAVQSTVLSLAGLRRLRFPGADPAGTAARNLAARTLLAALGLLGMARLHAEDPQLRSRCLLVYEDAEPLFELVGSGGVRAAWRLPPDAALALFRQAAAAVVEAGLPWSEEPLRLTPHPRLVELIRRSRAAEAAGETEDSPADAA
ncbi:type I-U CRISPR-associated protein Cas7 [Azospirillum sp. RWY-5-1]|uniref:Type I-U CRISPR-associated protein Cas7 n=1 Tax=Azospirillum oleiclasticum TaxID=2735135 RepID=A0ABX2TC24_9PROT|nr:type I-U CRISPR-associated RAMP protein Csb1/Cas7u [Azospirillum oleiclasticum]NYZ13542.1 type I-U CRISPR-associated protein Cas7 [Azospirillum oleiclasticum]NYZ20703.1 type I-U CRISPR-associated protein Cas7 [Azospirillum oleiclasticum]